MAAVLSLEAMLQLAQRVVPGLHGVVADCAGDARVRLDQIQPATTYQRPARCGRNRPALEALLAFWTTAHPEAGRAYWSLRCWGILIWQPIYLSVIGVHTAYTVLSLDRFEQPIENGLTREVRLPHHALAKGGPLPPIDLAAGEIAACCAQIFDELSDVVRLNAHAARCMQADCVLAALLALSVTRPHWNHAQIEALGERWLERLDLEGCSRFFAYPCSDGASALALDRQTCCYHYRLHDGELCSTCPRLEQRERIVRLNAQRDATRTA
jgi:siderophore ferric iron reductase